MYPENKDHRAFIQAARYGKVADKDGVTEALDNLKNFYRAMRVPRRDTLKVLERIQYDFESGKAHNQAKRGHRIQSLVDTLQQTLNIRNN